MNRDILRMWKLRREGAVAGPSGTRIAMICLVALFATGVWWVILYVGGWIVGYPIDTAVMLLVLAGIFLILVLGLSMAAMATSGTPDAPKRERKDPVANAPHPRRKAG